MKLPSQLDKVLSNLSQNNYFSIKEISMLLSKEIFSKNNNPFLSLYNLSFPTYKGFFNNNKKKENK